MSSPGVVVMVRQVALAGQEQVAAQEISALAATVLAKERDGGGIMILRHADEGARIALIEHWPSRQAFIGRNMRQPHVRYFVQRGRVPGRSAGDHVLQPHRQRVTAA